jgi:hypothetical protein
MPVEKPHCSLRRALVTPVVAAILVAAATGTALGADGVSATYTASGTAFAFTIANSGTTSWPTFVLVGPTGTTFLGGATVGEITTRCVAGQPDGTSGELECGPISASGLAPGGRLVLVATLTTASACGSPFQIEVSDTGSPPFVQAGTATLSGGCTAASSPTPTSCAEQAAGATSADAKLAELRRELTALGRGWSRALAAAASGEPGLRGRALEAAKGATAAARAGAALRAEVASTEAMASTAAAAAHGTLATCLAGASQSAIPCLIQQATLARETVDAAAATAFMRTKVASAATALGEARVLSTVGMSFTAAAGRIAGLTGADPKTGEAAARAALASCLG